MAYSTASSDNLKGPLIIIFSIISFYCHKICWFWSMVNCLSLLSWRVRPKKFENHINVILTYLTDLEAYQLRNSAAKHCICSILSTVPHGVKSTVAAPFVFTDILQQIYHLWLICLPMLYDCWEEKLLLMFAICSPWNSQKSNVPEHQKSFINTTARE